MTSENFDLTTIGERPMAEEEGRRWMCVNGLHVLGLAVRETGKGTGLLLFRHAVMPEMVGERDVLGLMYGEKHVECDLCKLTGKGKTIRTWWAREYELRRMGQRIADAKRTNGITEGKRTNGITEGKRTNGTTDGISRSGIRRNER